MAIAIEIARRSEGLSSVAEYLEALGPDRKLSLYIRAGQESDSLTHVYLELIRYGNLPLVRNLQTLGGNLSIKMKIILLAAGDTNRPENLVAAADAVVSQSPGLPRRSLGEGGSPSHVIYGRPGVVAPTGIGVPVR